MTLTSRTKLGFLETKRQWVLAATIGVGLWVDQVGRGWIVPGEYIVDVVVWAVFAHIFLRTDRRKRVEMLIVRSPHRSSFSQAKAGASTSTARD